MRCALLAAQAMASSSSIVIVTTGAIVGSILAPSPVYATAPVSVYVVAGTGSDALPVGYIARRYGRKATFYGLRRRRSRQHPCVERYLHRLIRALLRRDLHRRFLPGRRPELSFCGDRYGEPCVPPQGHFMGDGGRRFRRRARSAARQRHHESLGALSVHDELRGAGRCGADLHGGAFGNKLPKPVAVINGPAGRPCARSWCSRVSSQRWSAASCLTR